MRLWHRQEKYSDLEQWLQEDRPAPRDAFIRQVAGRLRPRRAVSSVRVAVAGILTVLAVAAFGALGGFGYAASAGKGAAKSVGASSSESGKSSSAAKSAAKADANKQGDNANVQGRNGNGNGNGNGNDDDEDPDDDQYEDGFVICHRPPGNPGNAHTITVGSEQARDAHIRNHGDTPGPCPGD